MTTKKTPVPSKTVDLAPLIAAQIVPMDCVCDGCVALARLYGSDPQLHLFYRRRLLQRGWAGPRLPEEKAFQASHLGWAASRPGPRDRLGPPKVTSRDGAMPEDEESGVDTLEAPA